jgi:DsbC/DsbD-like thiol-disulfide interchange protein
MPATGPIGRLAALAALATGAAIAAIAPAQTGLDSPAAEHARPRLIAEAATIAPGETILIGVTFDIEPGWHTYWHGLNDTVPGPWIEFKAPEGFEVGALQWPAPHRHIAPGNLLDHIYERQVTLLAPLTAPSDLDADSVDITADINWTVCADVCLMADATPELALPVTDAGASAAASRDAPRFAAARRRLPRPLRPTDEITTERAGDRIEIRVPGATRLAFYPHEKGPALADLLRDGEARAETLTLRLEPHRSPDNRPPAPLAGVLEIWRGGADGARDETQLIELRITSDGRAEPVERQPLPPPPQRPADGA